MYSGVRKPIFPLVRNVPHRKAQAGVRDCGTAPRCYWSARRLL